MPRDTFRIVVVIGLRIRYSLGDYKILKLYGLGGLKIPKNTQKRTLKISGGMGVLQKWQKPP